MALKKTRRRRGAAITSLIDVIFLLLLFFMLASTFSKQAEIELIAGAAGPASGEAADVVRLLIGNDSLAINGQRIAEGSLSAELTEAIAVSESIIAIELSEDATTQRLVDVLLKVNSIPGARIRVMEPS